MAFPTTSGYEARISCVWVRGREDDPLIEVGRRAVGDACRLAVSLGGTITAEHGVGLSKAPYLSLQRDEEHLALLRRVKAAFDPHGILNPGKWL